VAGLNFLPISGQSLAEGSNDGAILTTAQEYNNVMFAKGASSPVAYAAAFATGTNTETPMYGMLSGFKAALATGGLLPTAQMLTCNNGLGSYSILALGKGNAPFTALISQVAAGKSIADGEGRPFRFLGVAWLQGESDNAMSRADYRATLQRLADDYADAGRAAAGQSSDPILYVSQCNTNASPSVALAQLDAHVHPLIVVSGPTYPLGYVADNVHLSATGAKLAGYYLGLAAERVSTGQTHNPLMVTSASVAGAVIDLTTNATSQLAFDTTLVPSQANRGIRVVDASSSPLTINGIAIVGANVVRVTLSANVPAGAFVNIGFDTLAATGGIQRTNIRDSQGAAIVFDPGGLNWPAHNWMVIQQVALP